MARSNGRLMAAHSKSSNRVFPNRFFNPRHHRLRERERLNSELVAPGILPKANRNNCSWNN